MSTVAGSQPTPPGRVYLDSIGCRLNQGEMELLARQLIAAGVALAATPEQSDLVVLNTCTVTAKAAATSRSRARQLGRRQPVPNVVLTGCWATIEGERASMLEPVSRVVPNTRKSRLARILLGRQEQAFESEPIDRVALPGARSRTRAFIKAQDGCNHACSYCLTTIARGRSRSLPLREVIEQVRAAVRGGAKECILSGVQLSSYGRDLSGTPSLVDLCRAVLRHTDLPRLRLSSLEPWGLPDGFFSLWEDSRMCRQLHLPLQSGCADTLRRMRRPCSPDSYEQLVRIARRSIPGLAITTDLILGFPGESEEEFQESLDFVEQMAFTDAHVFPYSPRPGTPAATLGSLVDRAVARRRAEAARAIVTSSANRFRDRFVGQVLTVLWESIPAASAQGFVLSGWSDNYIRVEASHPLNMRNRLSHVRIEGRQEDKLAGTILPASGEEDGHPAMLECSSLAGADSP